MKVHPEETVVETSVAKKSMIFTYVRRKRNSFKCFELFL